MTEIDRINLFRKFKKRHFKWHGCGWGRYYVTFKNGRLFEIMLGPLKQVNKFYKNKKSQEKKAK